MARYVFIETRDPFESRDTRFVVDTAAALRARGRDVTVFLVQNGVLAARRAARAPDVADLARAGVVVLADEFSLAERGIEPAELHPGVAASGVDALVDALVEPGTKAVWH
jgi:predicted peroxiredoxin